MKKLTNDDWDNIQKSQPSRYYIQNVEDGIVRVVFDSEIFETEKGEEDILGYVWEKEWVKLQANAIINGEPKIYSLGGKGWSQCNKFIACCRNNEITPDNLPGAVFDVAKVGDFDYEYNYVGREEDIKNSSRTPAAKLEISENLLRDAKEVITQLKDAPALIEGGLLKPDFLKALLIRGKIKTTDTEKMLPQLVKEGILSIPDGTPERVFIL